MKRPNIENIKATPITLELIQYIEYLEERLETTELEYLQLQEYTD